MGTVNALTIAADHPAYAGHFPGQPLLPGVVLLDAALRQIALGTATPRSQWQIATAKFHSPVAPGTALLLEHEQQPDGSLRFSIRKGEVPAGASPSEERQVVASGMLVLRAPSRQPVP